MLFGGEIIRRVRVRFVRRRRADENWQSAATRRRRAEKVSNQQLQKVASARTIARLMTAKRDPMSKTDTVTIAAIEAGVPSLVKARALIDRFHAMIRKKSQLQNCSGAPDFSF